MTGRVNVDIDLNVRGAWERGLTGKDVVIGIVDNAIEIAHPDLAAAPGLSYDFFDDDNDPTPPTDLEFNLVHGTLVAGIAAARGGNGIGVTGAAPGAQIAGLRINISFTNADEAPLQEMQGTQALLWRNDVIRVKNHSWGITVPFYAAPLASIALAASAESGTINVFAAGNETQYNNHLPLSNSPHAITVSVIGSNGRRSIFAYGAHVIATVPGQSIAGISKTPTTDLTGPRGVSPHIDPEQFTDPDYTNVFGGTSAGAPVAAGVMALAIEANPRLNTRLAKHLLVRTSRILEPDRVTLVSDGGWRTNGGGFAFNQDYGFGLIDADAFTAAAVRYAGVTPLETFSVPTRLVDAPIPDGDMGGIFQEFEVTATTPLEEVLVTLDIEHPKASDLRAFLISPSGFQSRLFQNSPFGAVDIPNWTYLPHAFWGEIPQGTWRLQVVDRTADNVGVWRSFGVELRMGLPILIPEPSGLAQAGILAAATVLGYRAARRGRPRGAEGGL